MRSLMGMGLLLTALSVSAGDIVDLYGVQGKQAQKVLQKYTTRVQDIETKLEAEFERMGEVQGETAALKRLLVEKKQLMDDIKHEGSFAFVDLQTVVYPKDKNIYTTIEIVDSHQSNRLRFVPVKSKVYPPSKHPDVIDQMTEYASLSMILMIEHKADLEDHRCPVFHCVGSYHHSKLKPYLAVFNQAIVQEKSFIIQTLNDDPNPQRRASAAFLMGHAQDPREIISTLAPHVTDPDSHVRNNVLRVIAATIAKAHISDIDPAPFLALLDSPYETDRNKTLLVLSTIADSEQGKAKIIANGGEALIGLLSLMQPNNHNEAYVILKKISHHDYGDRQIAQWTSWLSQYKKPVARPTIRTS